MVRRVRTISNAEGQKLARLCRHPSDAIELHRAMVILSSAQEFTLPYIARLVGYSPDWVRSLIREFNLHGFVMLKPNRKAGGNWKFTQEQKDRLVVGELRGSPPPPLRLEHGHPAVVERADHLANVVLAHQRDQADLGRGEPLVAREDDLGALGLDGVVAGE